MSSKYALEMGNHFFSKKNYVMAKYYFSISIKSSKYISESLYKLILIEIKVGNYLNARKMLNENLLNNTQLIQLYGLLESIENNFLQSRKYYSECLEESDMKNSSLFSIAKLDVQIGDYLVAKNRFESLKDNKSFYLDSTFQLVFLNMINHNYLEAKRLMKEINLSKLSYELRRHYRLVYMHIMYFLGELDENLCRSDIRSTYMIDRLFGDKEELTINHIMEHTKQIKRDTFGCFFEEVCLKELLYSVKEKIKNMNANHFGLTDSYRFSLDSPIGYNNGIVTSDICVTTIIGTDDIINMYPVLLSNEFDKEGFLMSDELRLKRLLAVKKM